MAEYNKEQDVAGDASGDDKMGPEESEANGARADEGKHKDSSSEDSGGEGIEGRESIEDNKGSEGIEDNKGSEGSEGNEGSEGSEGSNDSDDDVVAENAKKALSSDVCDSLLSLRKYYETQKQHTAVDPENPWLFFVQWYRGKTYHLKHCPDPFARHEMYNLTTPCIKAKKYDIMFFRRGDLVNATMSTSSALPYVLCYDRIDKKYESYFLYADGVEEREAAMNSLKKWVSTAEETYDKGAKTAALSTSPINQISDISKYEVNDAFPHMWALFLQYFVGAALDISTCTRAVKPLERLVSDGIIYGSGYVIRIDDDGKVVHLDDTQYAIYGENAFDNLDALKRRVRGLEMMLPHI